MLEKELAEKVLSENIKVHALEKGLYFKHHPEQINFFQYAHLIKTINKTVNLLPENSCKILDIGCGTGYLFMEFLKKGFEVTGIDLSPEMITILEEKISPKLKPKANLINSNAFDYLIQKKEAFSLISMSAFLHHLFNYEVVLRKACSALQSGGVLLIFFEPLKQPITNNIRYFFHKLLKVIDETIYRTYLSIEGIGIPEENYIFSDFQRRFGGVEISDIHRILKSENLQIHMEEKYCARRYGVLSFVATKIINSENSFDIIAIKN